MSKPQTLSLNAWNAWRRESLDHLPSGSYLEWAKNHFGEEIWVRKKSMSWERREICREWEERNEKKNCASTLKRKPSSMDRDFYREFVEHSISIEENLSRICRRLKDGLDGSRICRESIEQTKSTRILLNGSKKLSSRIPEILMDREAVEILSRRNPEISMDRESVKMLSRR